MVQQWMCILLHNTVTSQGSHLDKIPCLEYRKSGPSQWQCSPQTVHTTTQDLEQFQRECLAFCLAISVSTGY
jgi:hypothetical protein